MGVFKSHRQLLKKPWVIWEIFQTIPYLNFRLPIYVQFLHSYVLVWSEMICPAQKHIFIMLLSVVQWFFFLPSNFYICPIHELREWIWMLLELLNFSWMRMFSHMVTKKDTRCRKNFHWNRLQETKGAFVLWCWNLWTNCCELVRPKCSAHWVLVLALVPKSVLPCYSSTMASLLVRLFS